MSEIQAVYEVYVKGRCKVWTCENCGQPLGSVDAAGGLRFAGETYFGPRAVCAVCPHCGRHNPWRVKEGSTE